MIQFHVPACVESTVLHRACKAGDDDTDSIRWKTNPRGLPVKIRPCFTCLFTAVAALPTSPPTATFAATTDLQTSAYRNFTPDGAWCWFADPRAIYFEGAHHRTYAGWVNSQGDIVVGAFDHDSGNIHSTTLHQRLEVDDHASPALVSLPDGRIRAFYSRHADTEMRTRVTQRPEDIASWEPERLLCLNNPDEQEPDQPNNVCYPNPMLIADGRMVILWRGTNWKPCLAISTDGGENFDPGRVVFEAPNADGNNRPYLKAACRDGKLIHLAFTTGHPRNEPRNSVYYCSFDGHTFRRADGEIIGTIDDAPIDPARCDIVHNGPETSVRAWIWDVAADERGRPALVYTRLPAESRHVYFYARWDGQAWNMQPIVDAGAWFPQTPEGKLEREPHYSGGVVLDHADPRRVYLARPRSGVFEIERWERNASDGLWTHAAVTSGSRRDNVRPVAIRDARADHPRVLWMTIDRVYEHYTQYGCSIRMDVPARRRDAQSTSTDR